MTPRRRLVLAAAIYLAGLYLFSLWRDLPRSAHVDEMEHLHVVVLMKRGLRPFFDFSEHHPPLFWSVLRPLVTATEGTAEMFALMTRARVLINTVLAMAIVAAALLVRRATGNSWAAIAFVGLLFAAGGVWRNGLGDVRPDSFAISLWWMGAALVLMAKRPSLRGIGLGLAILTSLIKPQWPLASLALGVVFLLGFRRELRALLIASAAAIGVAGVGVAITLTYGDLATLRFHIVTLTAELVRKYLVGKQYHRPFFACPLLYRPLIMALTATLVIMAWWHVRRAFAEPRIVGALIAITAASFGEIVFIYPFPTLDFRFYAFWSISAAVLLALGIHAAAALIPDSFVRLRKPVYGTLTVLALLAAIDIIPYPRDTPDLYWRYMAYLDRKLRPGDTMWMGTFHNPIDAHDASYYWFGQAEVTPVSLKLARTPEGKRFLPPITQTDLPPCRIERGLDPQVRFLRDTPERLPIARACFRRLLSQGRLERTHSPGIWIVRR